MLFICDLFLCSLSRRCHALLRREFGIRPVALARSINSLTFCTPHICPFLRTLYLFQPDHLDSHRATMFPVTPVRVPARGG